MSSSLIERLIRKNRVYLGKSVNFNVDDVRLPNRHRAIREYIDHPGAVSVIPFVGEDVILVRQYRHPVGRITYELPAGKLDKGESPLSCVRRELREETGFRALSIRRLLKFWPTAAFSNELLHIYVADRLVPGRTSPDEDEFLETVRVPFRKALGWVSSGRIKDSKTVIALLACALWGRSLPSPPARKKRARGRKLAAPEKAQKGRRRRRFAAH